MSAVKSGLEEGGNPTVPSMKISWTNSRPTYRAGNHYVGDIPYLDTFVDAVYEAFVKAAQLLESRVHEHVIYSRDSCTAITCAGGLPEGYVSEWSLSWAINKKPQELRFTTETRYSKTAAGHRVTAVKFKLTTAIVKGLRLPGDMPSFDYTLDSRQDFHLHQLYIWMRDILFGWIDALEL